MDLLKAFRKRHKLSQEALARYLEVSTNTLYRWESGKVDPGSPKILELALVELARRIEQERKG